MTWSIFYCCEGYEGMEGTWTAAGPAGRTGRQVEGSKKIF